MLLRHVFLQALRVSDGLEAGTCFVNCYNKTDVAAPFGGFKQSGFGKDLGEFYCSSLVTTDNFEVFFSKSNMKVD